MITNLPLLISNGNPTALAKLNAAELEKFITFMVTCSWGHDTAKDIRQPPWWPADVTFSHPFVKPPVVPDDWETRLKRLIKRCYEHHKSAFLLVFSSQLARYPPRRLRYVDNQDHTTSLYYRPSGRLLVTFRNENMCYDRNIVKETSYHLKSTDIYLCDHCDSHFDNLEVLKAHEGLCNSEVVASSSCSSVFSDLLSALKLQSTADKSENKTSKSIEPDPKPRNARVASYIDRGPPYPFSSLAYIKNAKINAQRDTSYSRERIERYCCSTTTVSKNVGSKSKNQQFPIRYRRPIDYWHRRHVFPNQRYKKVIDLKSQLLLVKCKPITVNVERMTTEKVEEYIEKLHKESPKTGTVEKDIVFVDGLDLEQMDVDNSRADVKNCDPLKKGDFDCEVIDLCSDDESSSTNENCDPRAGVTCVMRGGAVLRRTAATPQALPAEPCGARQRPLPSLILQPHPVILITHTLNNLQTIALD